MSIERRLAKRYRTKEEVRLFLREAEGLQKLAGPLPAGLVDISLTGAGIRMTQVVVDRHHIFYASLDSPDMALCLEFPQITTDDGEPFVIPVRPVWLDRDLDDSATPFRLGVEFLEKFPKDILKIVLES